MRLILGLILPFPWSMLTCASICICGMVHFFVCVFFNVCFVCVFKPADDSLGRDESATGCQYVCVMDICEYLV